MLSVIGSLAGYHTYWHMALWLTVAILEAPIQEQTVAKCVCRDCGLNNGHDERIEVHLFVVARHGEGHCGRMRGKWPSLFNYRSQRGLCLR